MIPLSVHLYLRGLGWRHNTRRVELFHHLEIVLAAEKAEWKPFREALDKKERNEFDEMWDIPRVYVSACSNSVQLVPLQPIMISILFHLTKN
jgi:hypothetical protein